MRPVLLEMVGFGSFREPTTVDFAEADYFALVGPTGAGKSTVIDAITFALFGSVPRWDDKRKVALALAPTATRGTVRLVFDVGPERYVVARELRRAASGTVTVKNVRLERLADPTALGALTDESEPVAADSKVTDAIECLLGLTFEHFCTCVVLPQGDFAEFLHARAGDRQKILVKLLGLEVYDQIARAANAEAAREKQNAELLGEQLTRYADATAAAQDDAQRVVAALATAETRLATALPQLAAVGAAAEAARVAVVALESERDRLRSVVVPAGLGELDGRLRSARGAAARAGLVLEEAEAADSAARAAVAGAPARGPVEQARRDRLELDGLVADRAGLVAAQSAAADRLAAADVEVEAAERVVEQARAGQSAVGAAAEAARVAVVALESERDRLRSVVVPAGLGELDGRLRSARGAAARAGLVLEEAEAADSAARAAVAGAPARGPVEQARRDRLELDGLVADRAGLVAAQSAAADRLAVAERALRDAGAAVEDARAARDAGARSRTAAALRRHLIAGEPCPVCAQSVATLPAPPADADPRPEADRAVTVAERAADAARADWSSKARAAEQAVAALTVADGQIAALDTALRAAAIGGGAVGTLPDLAELDRRLAERDALEAAARAADTDLVAARAARADADRDAAKIDAEATGVRVALRETRDACAPLGAPSGLLEDVAAGWAALAGWAESAVAERTAALAAANIDAERANQRLAGARQALATAAMRLTDARRAHTDASRAELRAAGELAAAHKAVTVLTARLGDAPDAEALAATLACLDALDRAARDADQRLRAARTVHTAAARTATETYETVASTVRGLTAVRDRLVPLGAPAIPADDPVGGWRAFADWAATAAQERERRLPAATDAVRAAERAVADQEQQLAAELAELDVRVPPDRSLTETAAPALAGALANARAAQQRLAERRREAADLQHRREQAETGQQVARQLGQLLRSDAFPRWLVASALDLLVAEASTTLGELSGGQFALTHEAGEFVVVDRADADSRRPVKTLSGGETFQASLALALALSTHLSTMAASGAARLDSIFLDEGFGTLDEATLEVVSATLENLAAGGDRMVGLVTHVAALAERVPVRFEVGRDQRTSLVTKVLA